MTKKKKIFLIILSIILFMFMFLCIKAYLFFNAKPNIAVNYVAEGNKISKPKNYDPCQNAYFDYQKAAAYAVQMPDIMSSSQYPEWPGDMNDSQLKILTDWLAKNNQALDYIAKGSEKTYYWFDAPENITETWNVTYPGLPGYRDCVHALLWRSKLLSCQNEPEKVLGDLLTCYRFSNHLEKGKTLVEYLVGEAMRSYILHNCFFILSRNPPKVQVLKKFQDSFESEGLGGFEQINFIGEKLFILDTIQRIFTDDGKGNGHLIPQQAKKLASIFSSVNSTLSVHEIPRQSFIQKVWNSFSLIVLDKETSNLFWLALTGPNRKQTVEKLDELMKIYDQLQQMTPWQLHKKNINPTKQVGDLVKDYLPLKSQSISEKYLFEQPHKQKCAESAFLTTIGILRFKDDRGVFPDSLDELTKAGYIKELPQDPYNDGPLSYKKVGDNFTLYSLGPNFCDDGGKSKRQGKNIWWDDEGDTVFWPIEQKGGK